jgi:hypothetical protein
MNSALLKWIANAVIGVVVVCTLWIAQAVQPEQTGQTLLIYQASASPELGASSPAR